MNYSKNEQEQWTYNINSPENISYNNINNNYFKKLQPKDAEGKDFELHTQNGGERYLPLVKRTMSVNRIVYNENESNFTKIKFNNNLFHNETQFTDKKLMNGDNIHRETNNSDISIKNVNKKSETNRSNGAYRQIRNHEINSFNGFTDKWVSDNSTLNRKTSFKEESHFNDNSERMQPKNSSSVKMGGSRQSNIDYAKFDDNSKNNKKISRRRTLDSFNTNNLQQVLSYETNNKEKLLKTSNIPEILSGNSENTPSTENCQQYPQSISLITKNISNNSSGNGNQILLNGLIANQTTTTINNYKLHYPQDPHEPKVDYHDNGKNSDVMTQINLTNETNDQLSQDNNNYSSQKENSTIHHSNKHKSGNDVACLSNSTSESPESWRNSLLSQQKKPQKATPKARKPITCNYSNDCEDELDTQQTSLLESSREIHMKALSELQTSSALRARPDVVYGTMIPDPDYSDEESETHSKQSSNNTNTSSSSPNKMVARNNRVNSNVSNKSPQKENKCSPGDRFDEKGLILPKKLPNPNLESTDKKSLHRELLFNQKLGISVLNQKSELQKALEKHKGKQALKEQEKEKQTQLTPLQRAIDERAQRLEKTAKEEEKDKPESDQSETSNEFQKIHAKFRSKIEAK